MTTGTGHASRVKQLQGSESGSNQRNCMGISTATDWVCTKFMSVAVASDLCAASESSMLRVLDWRYSEDNCMAVSTSVDCRHARFMSTTVTNVTKGKRLSQGS